MTINSTSILFSKRFLGFLKTVFLCTETMAAMMVLRANTIKERGRNAYLWKDNKDVEKA